MSYGKWTDKIADKFSDINDRLNLNKESWIHIGIAAGIAVIIGAIIVVTATPRVSTYLDDISQLNAQIKAAAGDVDSILGLGELATDDDINTLNSTIADHTDDIGTLKSRMNEADGRINAIANDIGTLVCSPPDAYLSGTFGNYALHIKSNNAGNFTANVHLVYAPPIAMGNATTQDEAISTFYTGINWTGELARNYVPTVAYNGTAWEISEVSFNIGNFYLEAKVEALVAVIFSGLKQEPNFSYAEVYPVLKN